MPVPVPVPVATMEAALTAAAVPEVAVGAALVWPNRVSGRPSHDPLPPPPRPSPADHTIPHHSGHTR